MTHELKILPCYFEAVLSGDKTFEIRDNSDRGFQKGDLVTLREIEVKKTNDMSVYTGRKLELIITYVTNVFQQPDYVVFGFKK
ncbi:MAG: DUF3850 domain-containing protein [Colwellia sp.]|nr:DUF3850 domain-containing protein [Colwellia sp.]